MLGRLINRDPVPEDSLIKRVDDSFEGRPLPSLEQQKEYARKLVRNAPYIDGPREVGTDVTEEQILDMAAVYEATIARALRNEFSQVRTGYTWHDETGYSFVERGSLWDRLTFNMDISVVAHTPEMAEKHGVGDGLKGPIIQYHATGEGEPGRLATLGVMRDSFTRACAVTTDSQDPRFKENCDDIIAYLNDALERSSYLRGSKFLDAHEAIGRIIEEKGSFSPAT